MGLDTVEIVVNVEDEFGIRIPDDVASEISTVGQLVVCVESLLNQANKSKAGVCPTAHAFHGLRDAMMAVVGAPRSSIRPGSVFGQLIPMNRDRAKRWKEIANRSGLSLPSKGLWRERLPAPDLTLRDIIQRYSKAGDVFRRVRRLVSEQMGIEESDVHRRSRFIQDLGMG